MSYSPPCLNNYFLIAMPTLDEAIFSRSVIYICEHGDEGAFGLIINKLTDLSAYDLMKSVGLEAEVQGRQFNQDMIYYGGPMESVRGFVLHSPVAYIDVGQARSQAKINKVNEVGLRDIDFLLDSETFFSYSTRVGGVDVSQVDLTVSKDILEAIAIGAGPARYFIAQGCASWAGGQLEDELAQNAWLTVAADPAIIFDVHYSQRYEGALALLGLESNMLSLQAGRA